MDSDAVCSICLDRLNLSSTLSILSTRQEKDGKVKVRLEPCKHEFHRACIERWLAGNQRLTCAYCRTAGKLLICCSSNQVLKTLLPNPPRSHSLHVSSSLMQRTMTMLLNDQHDVIASSTRRRASSRENYRSSNSSSTSTRSTFNARNSDTESSPLVARRPWFVQKFQRLRERIEIRNRRISNESASPSDSDDLSIIPSLGQTLEQFAETVDIVSSRLTPST